MAEDRLIPDARARRALERFEDAPLNFDAAALDKHRSAPGWHYDERLQPLAPESPGPPAPDGTWELSRRLMQGYEFADPSLVRAFYDPDVALADRTMLLEIRFHGLRFRVGCRVGEVYERTEQVDGAEALVWGWSYRTLKGHLEQGEMHWQVLKFPASGEVAFRIRSWSRRARDPNLVIRLGFRLFGRREQLRFYDSTCERMRRLTAEALRSGPRAQAVRDVAETVTARPTRGDDPAHDELARNVKLD